VLGDRIKRKEARSEVRKGRENVKDGGGVEKKRVIGVTVACSMKLTLIERIISSYTIDLFCLYKTDSIEEE
jgi:hypothetical protein